MSFDMLFFPSRAQKYTFHNHYTALDIYNDSSKKYQKKQYEES